MSTETHKSIFPLICDSGQPGEVHAHPGRPGAKGERGEPGFPGKQHYS